MLYLVSVNKSHEGADELPAIVPFESSQSSLSSARRPFSLSLFHSLLLLHILLSRRTLSSFAFLFLTLSLSPPLRFCSLFPNSICFSCVSTPLSLYLSIPLSQSFSVAFSLNHFLSLMRRVMKSTFGSFSFFLIRSISMSILFSLFRNCLFLLLSLSHSLSSSSSSFTHSLFPYFILFISFCSLSLSHLIFLFRFPCL
ncbi:unnamed protein product [Acanthosepion pharaonis]|uniref:Transmembrane protein n=1 Tax=Acanthosepion pharaonis TaxID=158019 RepID=A0A812EBV7_ACAPH|nr:unnamed protein product [Sepia pharaonis]